jgi:hypothetical protein
VVVSGGPLRFVLVCELFSIGRESSAAIVFLEFLLKIISCFFKELEPTKIGRGACTPRWGYNFPRGLDTGYRAARAEDLGAGPRRQGNVWRHRGKRIWTATYSRIPIASDTHTLTTRPCFLRWWRVATYIFFSG